MKFRVKFGRGNKSFSVVDDSQTPSLRSLKNAITQELDKLGYNGTEFEMSLNGRDVIEGEENTELNDLGVVTGDIIRLLISEESNVNVKSCEGLGTSNEETNKDSTQAVNNIPQSLTNLNSSTESNTSTSSIHGGLASSGAISGPSTSTADEEQISTRNDRTIDGEPPVDRVIVNRFLCEPLLCRESTSFAVPETLKQTFQLSDVHSIHDAIVVVLHVLIMEAGFIPKDSTKYDAMILPNKCKIGLVYRIPYKHPSCPNSVIMLTCVPMGGMVAVNGTCKSAVFHISLKPSFHVREDKLASKNVVTVYKNLPKLSHQFKDVIVYPLLTAIQAEEGVPPSCGMMSLPAEVKLAMLSFLDVRSLLSVSEVCREFNMLSDESTLWKRLCFTDFPEYMSQKLIAESSINWKEKYKLLYRRKQLRNIPLGPFFLTPPLLHPYPLFTGARPYHPTNPLMPPGILGGDFDRIPTFPVGPEHGPLLSPPGPRLLGTNAIHFPTRPHLPNMPGFFPRYL